MSRGYSVAQAARLVSALRWTCTRLSDMFAAWAGEAAAAAGEAPEAAVPGGAAEPAEAAASLWALSRRLASHREALDALQPDSERMATWRPPTAADVSVAAMLDGIAETRGASARLDIACDVLVPQLRRCYATVCEHAAPHCDGALHSTTAALGFDLDLGRRPVGRRDEAPGRRGVDEAHEALVAAGGLIEPSVLQPGDWP